MALNVLEQRALAELDLSHERPFRLTDHLSSVRAASAVVVLLLWEIFGRQINPLFLSYPSAIARALLQLLNAGEIQRSEEHTSELQSPYDLVCRLLLEKKKKIDQ